eukprot:NODE_5166_length_607_cov_216.682971.p2 GENE.NODE_5166_length_607_cov_216.682971~~NODE_5166_length_607_cov_216.682971.p2  ORF type:complete len:164 (+),score=35.53 NODE_5166_length_607_cov_216.682971:2-493(+)
MSSLVDSDMCFRSSGSTQSTWGLNPRVRTHLQAFAFLDEHGRAIDIDQHRRKLCVIEQEMSLADRVERDRKFDKERRSRDRHILAGRKAEQESSLQRVQEMREDFRRKRVNRGSALSTPPCIGRRASTAPNTLQEDATAAGMPQASVRPAPRTAPSMSSHAGL